MRDISRLGFIGLGTMGAPMCGHLARKAGRPVIAHDLNPEPLKRLAAHGVSAAHSVAEVGKSADLVFLSLPGGAEIETVAGELLGVAGAGQIIADCSTAPLALTRRLARRFAEADAVFIDAPVARTRAAAQAGTLAAMMGGSPEICARVRPFLACFATDITHCGDVGAGQIVKLMNNMVLMETVAALAEALTIARRHGVEGSTLLAALAEGSADSFALRNHAMKALLPEEFPLRAHSCVQALKDLDCALEAAREAGVNAPGAETARARLDEAIALGYGEAYYPALIKAIDR